jgi:hypothetical protein
MTNHMPQNPTSFLHVYPHTVHPAIRISEKDGTRPGFYYEQGSHSAWRSHTGAIRTVKAIFRDRSRITEGRQTGPSLSPPQHHPMDIESSSVQQTPESGRPPKRVSQACEACRYVLSPYINQTYDFLVGHETDFVECSRKKSRCPGEKPACSLCARLKQTCVYADDGSMPEVRSAAIERRMVSLLS